MDQQKEWKAAVNCQMSIVSNKKTVRRKNNPSTLFKNEYKCLDKHITVKTFQISK